MATTKTHTTAAPVGLTISRKGTWFTCTWAVNISGATKDYDGGQMVRANVDGGGWYDIPFDPVNRTASLNAHWARHTVQFAVCGKCKKYKKGSTTHKFKMSPWSFSPVYEIHVPHAPGTPSFVKDETLYNKGTFSWDSDGKGEEDNTWWTSYTYQSMLVKDCNTTDGAKLSWGSGQPGWMQGNGSSVTITENSELLADASWTRWIRVNANGPHGSSGWVYQKHVYATPIQAIINETKATRQEAGGYVCTVKWTADTNAAHPIEKTILQYAFATPAEGLECPAGASWQYVKSINDTSGKDGASFSVDTSLVKDQCLFVRVNNFYDSMTTYGFGTLADVGYLSDPTNMSLQTDHQTFRATITATNNSAVPDSFLVVSYITDKDQAFDIGIIPHGQNSVTVQCPDWSEAGHIAFTVRAVVGTYVPITRADGVGAYAVEERMRSENELKEGGAVPSAPSNVGVTATGIPGTIMVTWNWTWDEANSAEIAWADHDDAWYSTDEPKTYVISNLHASKWNISGLETGITWYVRVRLLKGTGDNATPGPWSPIFPIDLSSAPTIPVLMLSPTVVTVEGTVTASWSYSTSDGAAQASAELVEVVPVESGGSAGSGSDATEYNYIHIAEATSAQYVTFNVADLGWDTGETHNLAVRVVSSSGRISDDYSNAVSLIVAEPVTAEIYETSLETVIVEEGEVERTVLALTEMPLTLTVRGADVTGMTSVAIERAEPYHIIRPDESETDGYEGETIAVFTQIGDDEITISREDLIGKFDDSAKYRIVATVQDGLGQSARDAVDFEVHWMHQALPPEATVSIDNEELIAILTPVAPAGTGEGDTCDIYRLSVDKPELVIEGAEFGTSYVDPFPTLGELGGHRFVFRTVDGDYITEDSELAWLDLDAEDGDVVETSSCIINFGEGIVLLDHNVDVSNSWSKDFTETKYLGGSVQGDWNASVSRAGSVNAVAIREEDTGTIQALRRLATYPGICHVRTKEGSSFAANINVSEETKVSEGHKFANFSLAITRIDPQELDGMTLEEWRELNPITDESGV